MRTSFLIPVYNPDLVVLRLCVNSTLKAAGDEHEVIIVDDASSRDDTREFLSRCAASGLDNLKVLRNAENSGVSYSLNKAADEATGILYAPVDHDDMLVTHGFQYMQRFQQYYGINIHAKRLMFIIDHSGSMEDYWGGMSRLARAKVELIKAIRELPEDSEFAIMFYESTVRIWRDELVYASEDNKLKAIDFIRDFYELINREFAGSFHWEYSERTSRSPINEICLEKECPKELFTPHPRRVAGTPKSYSFNPETATLNLCYNETAASLPTEITLPESWYPAELDITVSDGTYERDGRILKYTHDYLQEEHCIEVKPGSGD